MFILGDDGIVPMVQFSITPASLLEIEGSRVGDDHQFIDFVLQFAEAKENIKWSKSIFKNCILLDLIDVLYVRIDQEYYPYNV
jgi:hypothetical protein